MAVARTCFSARPHDDTLVIHNGTGVCGPYGRWWTKHAATTNTMVAVDTDGHPSDGLLNRRSRVRISSPAPRPSLFQCTRIVTAPVEQAASSKIDVLPAESKKFTFMQAKR